jgi:hypothetical protein
MLWQWIAALYNASVALMTGTIIALVVSVLLFVAGIRVGPGDLPAGIAWFARWLRWVFLAVAVVTFLSANFVAWKSEHLERVAAELKNNPLLVGRIGNSITGNLLEDGQDKGHMALLLQATIRNKGADSIAEGWDIVISAPGKASERVRASTLPEITLTWAGLSIALTKSEALYEKAIAKPIVRGGEVSGWLYYVIGKDWKPFTDGRTAEIRLFFSDIDGKTSSALYTFGGEPMYYPGTVNPMPTPHRTP